MFSSKLLILYKIKSALIFLCLYGCITSCWAFEFSYEPYDGEKSLRKSMSKYAGSLYTQNKPAKTYGPVRRNETIWDIADNLRPDESISIVHMIVVLFKHNPDAFHKNNLNALLSGATLVIPEINQIKQLSKAEVDQIFIEHKQRWKRPETATASFDSDSSGTQTDTEATQKLKQVSELIKAIKANEQMMSENETNIVEHEAMMGNIEGILDNIETDYANKKPQTSKNNTDSSQIIMLPQSIDEIRKPVVDTQQDKQTQRLDSSSQNGINEIQNSPKTAQIPQKDIQSERLTINAQDNAQERSISLQTQIIIICILLVIIYLLKSFKFKLVRQSVPLFQHELQEDDVTQINNKNLGDTRGRIEEKMNVVFANQVNIFKFLGKPDQLNQNYQRNKKPGILESVFEINSFCAENESIITEPEPSLNTETVTYDIVESEAALNAIEEKSPISKGEAFFIVTHPKNLTYEILANEFEHINNHQKIEVFIKEFKQLISKLTVQSQIMNNEMLGLEKVQQFKSSLQSIIKLSDMIQANHLNNLSQKVLEFLEEIINADVETDVEMSEKISRRLSLVVDYYNRYIHSVEINRYYKANFTSRNF